MILTECRLIHFRNGLSSGRGETRTSVEDGRIEPRIVIYNGHLSHINFDTLKYGRKNNVTILKPPLHTTTDLLQPLYISVFKSLKDK